MRAILASSLTLAALLGCQTAPGGESSIDACSNARDDDGDGLVDCADPACRVYAFCLSLDAGTDAGPIDAALPDGALCTRPLDVVMVLDVSSSMTDELARVRMGVSELWDEAHALDPSAQISLVVFVDDALAVAMCAPFASAASLDEELGRWMEHSRTNTSPSSGTFNQDCAENSLDALYAASTCPFRAGSARVLLHVTDDTFVERPAVLSGPFGGGVVVIHTYAETADALVGVSARVVAITQPGAGTACGAGLTNPDVGRGFHTSYMGQPALPERTGGLAIDIAALRSGSETIGAMLRRAAMPACL